MQTDGDLEVSIGETVTVVIEATDTAFLAHTGPISTGQWRTADHVTDDREVRTFTVSQAFSSNFSFTMGFDFSIGPDGKVPGTAQYRIRVTGSGPGGAVRERVTVPTAILPAARVFSFEVGQG